MNRTGLPSYRWLPAAIICLVLSCGQPIKGATQPAGPSGPIPLTGGVEHFVGPDGQSSTWIAFAVAEQDAAPLPDSVEAVSVTVNGAPLPLSRSDFTYFPDRRLFWASLPGIPLTGDYEIRVRGRNRTGLVTDRLTTLLYIDPPRPDDRSPNPTAPCATHRPLFAWQTATADAPLYYRLEIASAEGRVLFRSDNVRDRLSLRVPDGVLEPGRSYRWRARCMDSDTWTTIQNRSQTPWIRFTTADRFIYDYRPPSDGGDGLRTGDMRQAAMNSAPVVDLGERIINRDVQDIHSLLIFKDGRLVFEDYFYGHDRDTLHRVASVTKSVVSLLVGIAVDHGWIPDVDQPVTDYFPDFVSAANFAVWRPMRLYHLLTMSAGLDWDAATYPREDPRQTSHQMYASPDPLAFVFQRRAVADPGRVYNYNSGLTLVLGEIIRRAAGEPADRFAKAYLFDPLGIAEVRWERLTTGVVAADGGLFLRPRDMGKIGLLVLGGGAFNGRRVVSAAWVEESTRAHIAGSGEGYGYQWRSARAAAAGRDLEVVYASGLGGQRIFIIPQVNAVVVVTSKTHYHPGGGSKAERLLLERILPSLLNTDPVERPMIAVPVERLRALAGRYESTASGHAGSVAVREGKLYLHVPGHGSGELFFTAPDRCVARIDGLDELAIQVVFTPDGRVDHARLSVGLKSYRLDKVE